MKPLAFFRLFTIFILLATLAGCCILGDVCESGITESIQATQTAVEATASEGAAQFHIQLTAIAGDPAGKP